MSKNKNLLLFASIVAVLLLVIALPLMWLRLPLLVVIGGLSLLVLPMWSAFYRGNKKTMYVLLGILCVAALCVLVTSASEWSMVSRFEEACDKFDGSVIIEDFQYICLNESHKTSVLSADMLSGPISNGAIVLYAGVFLLNALYVLYLLLLFARNKVWPPVRKPAA